MAAIVAAVEAEEDALGSFLADLFDAAPRLGQTGRQGFFAQHRFARLDRLDDQFDVRIGGRGDDDRVNIDCPHRLGRSLRGLRSGARGERLDSAGDRIVDGGNPSTGGVNRRRVDLRHPAGPQ